MPDPYPLFLQGGLAARPIEKVGRFVHAALDAGDGRRAAWVTPQGFNYGDFGQVHNRGPRLLELRNQLYQAAVYGARGFLWYTYGQVANYPDLDLGIRWLSREVADLRPYLLAPLQEVEIAVEADHPEHLHAALRRVGSQALVIVVSTATAAQEVALRLPELAGDLQVVSEGRTVAAPGGVLRDHFDVSDTHLYATDPIEVRFDAPVTTAALRLLVTGNRAGQDATVVYEVEAYAE